MRGGTPRDTADLNGIVHPAPWHRPRLLIFFSIFHLLSLCASIIRKTYCSVKYVAKHIETERSVFIKSTNRVAYFCGSTNEPPPVGGHRFGLGACSPRHEYERQGDFAVNATAASVIAQEQCPDSPAHIDSIKTPALDTTHSQLLADLDRFIRLSA